MAAPKNRGNGKGIAFLRANVGYQGDECLIWPLSTPNGYGALGYLGKQLYAHRFMCELAHGPAPEGKIEAAHTCGNGKCVNPRHLEWKTPSDNQADRAAHGTKSTGSHGKLTQAQVDQIKALRGKKPQREIAAMFGITRSNVSHIQTGKHRAREVKGFSKVGNKYIARIKINYQHFHLGYFDTESEARAAAKAARLIALKQTGATP